MNPWENIITYIVQLHYQYGSNVKLNFVHECDGKFQNSILKQVFMNLKHKFLKTNLFESGHFKYICLKICIAKMKLFDSTPFRHLIHSK